MKLLNKTCSTKRENFHIHSGLWFSPVFFHQYNYVERNTSSLFPGCELELEKRYPQYNLIEKTHPLLPSLSDCLSPNDNERPSTSDLCTRLTSLKATIRAESPAKFSQRSQSIGSHLSEDESWLPVHVQVMEALEYGGRGAPVRHGFEENPFELEKPVYDVGDLPCKSEVLSVLSCSDEHEEQLGKRRKDTKILSKQDELLEVLQCAVEEKSREVAERDTQVEAVKRDRLELSVRLQQLQKEMTAVRSRNSRLEKELASKEKEIERLRSSAECEFCSFTYINIQVSLFQRLNKFYCNVYLLN